MNPQLNLFPGPEKSFYNTIKAERRELSELNARAATQEQAVLQAFEAGEKLTPLEVKRRTGLNQDSVKRSITNLTKRGKLEKLGKEEMIVEEYGVKNHRWVKKDNL